MLEHLEGLAVPTSSAVGNPSVTYSQPLHPRVLRILRFNCLQKVSCGGSCLLKNSTSVWAFADTACVPLALLSCRGKVICILTCASILIICFSAEICILQGQRSNLVSSLFLTPARISTGTLLEWETLQIPNTY